MLEFIVLGQIPGTNLQITLAWFAFAILGLLLWADIKLHIHSKALQPATKKTRKSSSRARA